MIKGVEVALLNLTSENFKETISGEGIVLIDCWAAWCNACKEFQPVFEEVAGKYPDHTFAKLDTQAEEDLVKSLEVEHIPTLLLFKEGIMLFKQPGYFDLKGLDDILAQAQSIDMNEVRAYMEKQEKEE